jgi:hypothetical protein
MRTLPTLLASAAVLAVLAPPALADDASDFDAVFADYQPDADVTSCAFTRPQLEGARRDAQRRGTAGELDALIAEVDREIAVIDSGFCAGVAQPPSNNPPADLQAVASDYSGDGQITPCRFTRQQLVNAHDEAGKIPDIDSYAPGFRDEIRAEIANIDSGACPGFGLQIVRIKARGRAPRELVTLRNTGRGRARLNGVTLRDRRGRRIGFLRRLGVARGASLTVVTGCFRRFNRPVRFGSTFYACRTRQLWNQAGGVAKLVGPGGKVISQRGYGRHRGVPRF